MNIRKRIAKLELPRRKLREKEVQLEQDAKKAGLTLMQYRELQREIAAMSAEELIKLAGMSPLADR
jgi:rRNA processing protein Krr1/Pno1